MYERMTNEEREQYIIEYFDSLKPFESDKDIPHPIPVVSPEIYTTVIIPNLIRCGAISKDKLIIGKEYIGDCRNSGKATWDGEKFIYKRYKWGSYFNDDVQHFEDGVDNVIDVFVPIKLIEE